MSNLVEQINDAITAEVKLAVSSSFKELDYIWAVEKNTFYNNKDRFGVRPMGMDSTNQVNKQYSVDQEFEVILTGEQFKKADEGDLSTRTTIFALFDEMDKVIKQIHKKRAGLPSLVFNTMPFVIDDPEILEGENGGVIILRGRFTINYRAALI